MTCKVRSGPAALAAELCRAGIWERAEGGYRSLDAEAVQVRADRVRELREHDAWLAGLPGGARSEPATGAAGTTRFGGRVAKGAAASFQCGQCGEVAGVVRVARAGGAGPGTEPMLRSGSPGLVAQELAAWAVGTGLARGVVLDAALAAAPAGKGRRAGLAVRPRDLSFARAVRAVLSAIRLGHACYQAVTSEIGNYRNTVDRNRHRARKSKSPLSFAHAGPADTVTRIAPAVITMASTPA